MLQCPILGPAILVDGVDGVDDAATVAGLRSQADLGWSIGPHTYTWTEASRLRLHTRSRGNLFDLDLWLRNNASPTRATSLECYQRDTSLFYSRHAF